MDRTLELSKPELRKTYAGVIKGSAKQDKRFSAMYKTNNN